MQINISCGEKKIAQHQVKMPALCDSVFTYRVLLLSVSFVRSFLSILLIVFISYFLFACIFLDCFDKSVAIFLDLEFSNSADETECLEGGWLHPG